MVISASRELTCEQMVTPALRTPEAVGLLQPFAAAHTGDVVLVERRGQVGDAFVAEVDEVLGHELRRAEVVHVHGVDGSP